MHGPISNTCWKRLAFEIYKRAGPNCPSSRAILKASTCPTLDTQICRHEVDNMLIHRVSVPGHKHGTLAWCRWCTCIGIACVSRRPCMNQTHGEHTRPATTLSSALGVPPWPRQLQFDSTFGQSYVHTTRSHQQCEGYAIVRKREPNMWTHWDLNPGPSACEADVIPLHHEPVGLW